MTTQKKLFNQTLLICGLVVAAIPIIYTTVLQISGQLLDYLYSIPRIPLALESYFLALPLMIIVAIYRFKKINNGYLKFKEALVVGLKVVLIAVGVLIVYDILFNILLAPNFYTDYYELHGEQMLEEITARGHTEDPLAEFEGYKEKKTSSFWAYYSEDVIRGLIIGVIAGSLAGLIMKKKRPKT